MAIEATEICLLWGDWQIQRWWSCMDTSLWGAWAGWAQAFAALVALGISIRASGAAERMEKRDVVIQARTFAEELVPWMQAIGYAINADRPEMLRISIEAANELADSNPKCNTRGFNE